MNVMQQLEVDDLKNFLRMDIDSFEELLDMVTPIIKKQDSLMRKAISARERLTATLRFLVSGQSYEDLKFSTIISPQLMSTMIPETCWAIYKSLKHYIKVRNKTSIIYEQVYFCLITQNLDIFVVTVVFVWRYFLALLNSSYRNSIISEFVFCMVSLRGEFLPAHCDSEAWISCEGV